jgi:WD40 repeat protein
MAQDGPGNGDEIAPVPSAPTEAMPKGFLAPGQVLDDRYQIKTQLGRGGMGEVWRAFDLKLRVEVALKALREDLFKDEGRLELLRREVRAAREVVSPNVCRIFDLIEVDGRELVSMEYVDGGNLLEVLQERGPLDLKEAQDIASQFLAGLEAIHQAGLVHRDVKPENIMISRAGRVVLMDFGLAKQEDSGAGTVSGTPAYMAPEQAAGLKVDARADVYSAGVVLAEMVSPEGIKSFESRQSVWEGIRREPSRVPNSPWAPVLKKAVGKEPDQRYKSAHTLTRALEDVTLRVEGAEDVHPYPGLASFTEEDAEYFFGREAEVEAMWSKLGGPARLLGLVGASGAGKTSFLRAGLIPNASPEWVVLRCTPGSTAMASMRRALVPALGGDTEALSALAGGDDEATISACSVWRAASGRALLIVDQFEELFTLNSPETQAAFAGILQRLPLEADVHVVLAMRDDFLTECNRFESLRPIIPDLTLLDSPTGTNLRRALVSPATKCGYRFENDELVDEMLGEVEGERGALPLLAFAAARLWEQRDREAGLITRRAYQQIGGVGGALARHAEMTLDRLGADRIPVVRELFRNLVTAEGTRAVRDWDDLLSIFDASQRDAAEDVLRGLIDARLLTSYEVHGDDKALTRNVEIIHESLLANWPRLVRWQTQDLEGAQLRDELRQSARSWDERGRHEDRLWTGTAFREFQVWRERYKGGLTDLEEAFAAAMTALANRRRRRRQLAVMAGVSALAVVLVVVTGLWQRSVRETRRAEAQKLVALGQVTLDEHPTATVAYAISSLELADTPEARRLALEALWRGPTAFVLNGDNGGLQSFSPDGRWLVQWYWNQEMNPSIRVHSDDGSVVLEEQLEDESRLGGFSPEGDMFFTGSLEGRIELWSASEHRKLAEWWQDGGVFAPRLAWSNRRMVVLVVESDGAGVYALHPDGTRRFLGTVDLAFDRPQDWFKRTKMDVEAGRWLVATVGSNVLAIEIGEDSVSEPRLLGRHEGNVTSIAFDPAGHVFATASDDGLIKLWPLESESKPTVLHGPPGIPYGGLQNRPLRLAGDGSVLQACVLDSTRTLTSWVWSLSSGDPVPVRRFDLGAGGVIDWKLDPNSGYLAKFGPDLAVRLWSLSAPAAADPTVLRRGEVTQFWGLDFDPLGRGVVTADVRGFTFWPLAREYPAVIRRHADEIEKLVFGPRGEWLISGSYDGTVKLWPLAGHIPPPGRTLLEIPDGQMHRLARSPDGSKILVGTSGHGVRLLSLDGRTDTRLQGLRGTFDVAMSPDGRFAVAGGLSGDRYPEIRVWNALSGEGVSKLKIKPAQPLSALQFDVDGRLLFTADSGLRMWDLESEQSVPLHDGAIRHFPPAPTDEDC